MAVRELKFSDMLSFDPNEKTIISTRDGVAEYYGLELGLEPADKKFLLYRSPAVVANMARMMPGIPIVDGHSMLDGKATIGPEGGTVQTSEYIDLRDESNYTTLAVKNKIVLTDEMLASVQSGKRGVSVDGSVKIAEADPSIPIRRDYDILVQIPEHIAICDPDKARLGRYMQVVDSKLSREVKMKFKDKLKSKIAQVALCDAEGELNLQAVAELMADLPEAIKTVPLAELDKILPPLRELIAKAKGAVGAEDGDGGKVADEEDPEKKKKAEEEAASKKADDDKKLADAVNEKALKLADAMVQNHGTVITRALKFLPDTYDFSGKSTNQIMRDALATVTDMKIADSELKARFDVAQPRAGSSLPLGTQLADVNKLLEQEF